MRILLDTCVLSEIRRAKGNPRVRQAVAAVDDHDLFISVVSVGEIVKGIGMLKDTNQKRALLVWLETLEREYSDRVLAIDLETSHIWGDLTARAQKKGKVVPATDGLIAATAQRYGLHVMTRNTEHFEPTGVPLLNPWVDN